MDLQQLDDEATNAENQEEHKMTKEEYKALKSIKDKIQRLNERLENLAFKIEETSPSTKRYGILTQKRKDGENRLDTLMWDLLYFPLKQDETWKAYQLAIAQEK